MQFKYSALAASLVAAITLSGCGGSDSNSDNNGGQPNTGLAAKPQIAIPTQGQFIDAKVEGLHYVSGSKSGLTNAEGTYDIDATAPSVKFYLGGEKGLLIGSVSSRHITTPFEAAGTHQRAVNLARLLLTINELGTDTSSIVIPSEIQNPADAVSQALNIIKLDDESTFEALLITMNKAKEDLVAEQDAIDHMSVSLAGIQRGSSDKLTHWEKGSNWTFVQRSAKQRVKNDENSTFQDVIHADRTLGDDVFKKTGGLAAMYFSLQADNFVLRQGSNDSTISSQFAAEYMTCASKNGELSWVKDTNDDEVLRCDGEKIDIAPIFDDVLNNAHYQYSLTDPTSTSAADEMVPWSEVAEMGGAFACMANQTCTEQSLTKFSVITRDDADEGEQQELLKEVLSGSYDPITDVYVQTRSKQYQKNSSHPGRVSESITFLYPVEAVGQDRYVDFTGTWITTMTRNNCDLQAVSKHTFTDTGVTVTGQELNTENGQCKLVDFNGEATYAQLAKMDFWWFGTNDAGASKATLDQLNTTVRWNDREEGETKDDIKINRFSYIPAGKAWDQGVLIRDTLNSQGETTATILMKKEAK